MKHYSVTILIGIFSMLLTLPAQAIGLYQAVVSPKPNAGEYSSINEAIQKAPDDNSTYSVFIKPGLYNEQIIINRNNVHLIGSGKDKTIIAKAIAAGMKGENGKNIGTSGSRVVEINGTDFTAQSLTIRNDFDYLANDIKAKDDPSRIRQTQAVALLLGKQSDRSAFYDVSLEGFQDTFYSKGGRSYFNHSRISGTVDFIFGNGLVVFDNSDIVARYRPNKELPIGYLTAPSTNDKQAFGLVFINSRLIKEDDRIPAASYALGRPWHPTTTFQDGRYADPSAMGSTTFINSEMDDHIYGWDRMHGKDINGQPIWFTPENGARFSEYKNYGSGASIQGYRPQLTDNEATKFTIKNMLDGWQPIFASNQKTSVKGHVSAHLMTFPAQVTLIDQYGKNITTTTDKNGVYQLEIEGFIPPFIVSASEENTDCLSNNTLRGICMTAFYTPKKAQLDKNIHININPITDLILSDLAVDASYLGSQQVVSKTTTPIAFSATEYNASMARFHQGFNKSLMSLGLTEEFDPAQYQPQLHKRFSKVTKWLWTNRNYHTKIGEVADSTLMDRFFNPLLVPNLDGQVPEFDLNATLAKQKQADNAPHRIFIIGDSTASIYPEAVAPRMGWGQVLQNNFEPSKAQVINGAQSGRSSRSYYNQGWFRYLSSMMRPNDYLLIQFGHNDEKCNEASKGRGPHDVANTCTYPNNDNGDIQAPKGEDAFSFQRSLEVFVHYAQSHKVTPVLLTPVTRVKNAKGKTGFPVASGHITKQNKDSGFAYFGDYIQTVKDTAKANNIVYLDLEARTIELANELGEPDWKSYWLAVDSAVYPYYKNRTGRLDKPDTTHFQEKGANAVAKLVIEEIKKQPELQELISSLHK
ncbi:pectinesterase family protein [Marinomonas sp.]|uniref:pectinesterase family protein n=1 Tax=Marinomonas sp. TaxID=1904862 RepID=UPI003BAC1D36